MKQLGEIRDHVTALYTCDAQGPYVQFGGWDKATAQVKDEVHRIKTRTAESWDMQLKRVFMNGEAIYSEYTTEVQRRVLFEPTFQHIHIPLADFEAFQEVIKRHNDNDQVAELYTCGPFLAGQQGCYFRSTSCAEIDKLPQALWKIRVGTYGDIKQYQMVFDLSKDFFDWGGHCWLPVFAHPAPNPPNTPAALRLK